MERGVDQKVPNAPTPLVVRCPARRSGTPGRVGRGPLRRTLRFHPALRRMSERAFRFWQRWLVAASVCFCAFGVGVALAPDAPLLAPWNAAVARTFYGGAEPGGAAAFRAFVMGPLGATIAGSYLLQAFVAAVPFARRERWAWWATAGALALWFTVDSSLSLAHGAAFNVVLINLAPLAVFIPPLVATRRAFGRPAQAGGAALSAVRP